MSPNGLLTSMDLSVHEVIGQHFADCAKDVNEVSPKTLAVRLVVPESLVEALESRDIKAALAAVETRTN